MPSFLSVAFPISFKRQNAQPLDVDTVFDTKADMDQYLTNSSALVFAGQLAACVEDSKLYMVQGTGAVKSWIAIGPPAGGLGGGTVNKASSLIGDGTSKTLTYNHNLTSSAVNVNVWDNFTGDMVFTSTQIVSLCAIKFDFTVAPEVGQYRVVVTS